MKFLFLGRRKDSKRPMIDDAIAVPDHGSFLRDQGAGVTFLPTYAPIGGVFREISSDTGKLTILDAVAALREEYFIARCTMYETTRLQRGLVLRRDEGVRLPDDARKLDMALHKAIDQLHAAGVGTSDMNLVNKVLQDPRFTGDAASAKKNILRLEKKFRDTVRLQLQTAMIDRKKINHGRIASQFKKDHDEAVAVCAELRKRYFDVQSQIAREEREAENKRPRRLIATVRLSDETEREEGDGERGEHGMGGATETEAMRT